VVLFFAADMDQFSTATISVPAGKRLPPQENAYPWRKTLIPAGKRLPLEENAYPRRKTLTPGGKRLTPQENA
jgi:hypothetical protein